MESCGVLCPLRYFLSETTEPPPSPFQADGEENGDEEKDDTKEGNKEEKNEDEHEKSESRLVFVDK